MFELATLLFSNATRDGKDLAGNKWKVAFSSRETMTFYKAMAFAIEVNMGDFFDVARGWFARRPRPAPAPVPDVSPSPTT